MIDQNLFYGIAVVIDDEVGVASANIGEIQKDIQEAGCHVVAMTGLPEASAIVNFGGASFFIVDWNMYGTELAVVGDGPGVAIPKDLGRSHTEEMIDFLKRLKGIRLAPVFVFTNESVESIEEELKKHPDLYDQNDPSHILVKSKSEVREKGVFSILAEWLQRTPSAYVLKRWESAYEKAKNTLFLDFYAKSVYWPLILKKAFEEDNVSPSAEIGKLIGRNILSRMPPFSLDLDSFDASALEALEDQDADSYRKTVVKVLEGERFLPNVQLDPSSAAPGDVFKFQGRYLVNIRPECDCIARDGSSPDDIQLYLLSGDKLSPAQVGKAYDAAHGVLKEFDNETIVFPIKDGITVSFRLKELSVSRWADFKDKRVGRLLPPFLTRLQQRFSAYLQRPGITRIPVEAIPSGSHTAAAAPQEKPQG